MPDEDAESETQHGVSEPSGMATGEDEPATLRERVRDLENTVTKQQETIQQLMPSRRAILAGGAGLVGGAALTGQASAQSAAGQVGTASEPVDVEAATINADSASVTNQLDAGSVNTDELSIGSAKANMWLDGYLVPIAPGLDASDAIDHTQYDDPVNRACNKINNQTFDGGGTILVPRGVEQNGVAITGWQNKRFIGFGVNSGSYILQTDLATDLFQQGADRDGANSFFTGLSLFGNDETGGNRTSGSCFHFGNGGFDGPRGFNLGRVRFAQWSGPDPIIRCNGTTPFDCHWSWPLVDPKTNFTSWIGGGNTGIGGTGITVSNAIVGNSADVPIIQDGSRLGRLHIQTLQVEGENVDGATSPSYLWDAPAATGQELRIGSLQFEAAGSHPFVVRLNGAAGGLGLNIDNIQLKTGSTLSPTYDDVVVVGNGGANNGFRLGRIDVGPNQTLSGAKINCVGDVNGQGARYDGPTADVANNSGSTLTTGIYCWDGTAT